MSNNALDKKLAAYYKQIKKKLVCSSGTKKEIIHYLQQDVAEYLTENPNATEEDILQHFGEPDVFAAEYISGFEDNEIDKKISKIKSRKIWLIIALVVIVIIVAIGTAMIVETNSHHAVSYYEKTIIVGGTVSE